MPSKRSTLMLSISLGLMLASACTSTPDLPSAPATIPVRAELRQACAAVATPAEDTLPALAPANSEARRVQLVERAFWMEFVLLNDGVSADQCARYLELLALIDAYNTAAREAARSWPR